MAYSRLKYLKKGMISTATLETLLFRYPNVRNLLFLIPTVLILCCIIIFPICKILIQSIMDPNLTLKNYLHLFKTPIYFHFMWITFRIAIIVTAVSLVIGYPVAHLLSSVSKRTCNLLMIFVMIPFWTSLLVRCYAWMVLLQREGIINKILIKIGLISTPLGMMYNSFGVTIGMVHILLPFMILPLFSVMKGVDRNILKASDNLGASPFQTFLRVFFPLTLPGVAAGCILVFALSLGFFITPALLGGKGDFVISMAIAMQINELVNWGLASSLASVLLIVTILIFLIYDRFWGLDKIWGGV